MISRDSIPSTRLSISTRSMLIIIKWPEECHDVKKIQEYWLANLPDLNQSHAFVGQTLLNWVKYLIQEYDFDGCRVDTVIQVPKPFWSKFQEAGNVFMLGEANNGNPPCGSLAFTAGFQGSLDAVLDFPLYWTLRYIFQEKKQNFTALSALLKESADAFLDSSVIGGFIDNHDHARFLSLNPSFVALRNNLVYVFMSQCIPILYYGTEQGFNGDGDPNNRESLWPYMNTTHVLYTFVKHLLKIRANQSSSWLESSQIERYVSDTVYAFSRKNMLVVVTTAEARQTTNITVKSHPFKAGQRVHNLLNKKQLFQVSSTGDLKAVLTGSEPLILTTLESGRNGASKFPLLHLFYIFIVLLCVTMQDL